MSNIKSTSKNPSSTPNPEIIPAATPQLVAQARRLFQEYAAELNIDLCFQNFEEELATLPGKYAPPKGRLLLARPNEEFAGCVALRPLDDGLCEMKRLYVSPPFRGSGIGKLLASEIITQATKIGYRSMRLDTLATMKPAIALYESMGFRRIAPYCYNPDSRAVFMELELGTTD